MTDVFAYSIAGLLLVQALLRCRAALHGRTRERSLWGAFAALAASWLSRTEPGRELINLVSVPDLAYLVKHSLAILGICVLLKYVTAVYQDAATSASRHARTAARVHRIATRASLGTITIMTLAFFTGLSTPHPDAAAHFMARHAGEPGLALYMGLFYGYTASAAAVCAIQWGAARRHAPMRSLRVGLAMMSAGMTVLVLYALVRTAHVVLITVNPVSDGFATAQEAVTDSLLYTGFLLWVVGSITPAVHSGSTRYRTYRSLIDLHPLWRDLALVTPDVVRHQPSGILNGHRIGPFLGLARDLAGRGGESCGTQLGRYVTEIRDSIHELRRHAPADLADRALRFAHEDQAAEPRIRAEAYWIRAARTTLGGKPGCPAPFPFHPGGDLAAEVPHLRAVAAAYTRADERKARQLLGRQPAAATA
ncbi:MAB_1171c family putative transporter [Streptomyces tsukubensis]|uniref:MAB_1171c family putative transporter n=1 Tax=Streptomyces tsukubensis TaxID=83656 RepID=UPI0036BD9549